VRAHGVDPAEREHLREPLALDGKEARVLHVLLRAREVERRVRDVDVAADGDRAVFLQQIP
jgi:hypothetical protein